MTIERTTRSRLSKDRSPKRSREAAAARLERRTLVVLEEALERSEMTQAKLAEVLDVTAGRVSQIFAAEANLTLSTLARVLAAMNYDAVVSAVSIKDGSRIDPRVRIGQAPIAIDAYHQTFVSRTGTKPRIILVPAGESPEAPTTGAPELIGEGTAALPRNFEWQSRGRAVVNLPQGASNDR